MNHELKYLPEQYQEVVNDTLNLLVEFSNEERVLIAETAIMLLNGKLLAPIQETDEFVEVGNSGIMVNVRCPRIVKDGENYIYNDAICWIDEENKLSQGQKEIDGVMYDSSMKIKSFPFEPRTFYVKSSEELKEALEYYDQL